MKIMTWTEAGKKLLAIAKEFYSTDPCPKIADND